MHKLYLALFAVIISIISVYFGQNVSATSGEVLIYQIQAGGAANTAINGFITTPATREFISIYNNTDQMVDITDWCLLNKSDKPITCFGTGADNIFLHLPGYSYVTVASDNFVSDHKYEPDFVFATTNLSSGSVVGSSDSVKLVDANGIVIDEIAWTSSLPGGYLYQRSAEAAPSKKLVDSGVLSDFTKLLTLLIPNNKSIEEFEIFDACKNIVGIQPIIPDGYELNDSSDCIISTVDVCQNIDGIQLVMPIGYLVDVDGYCYPDACLNLDGLQISVPDDMVSDNDKNCFVKPLTLKITEMLPNPSGGDIGNEFIEIYNPNNIDVDLSVYGFYVDGDMSHKYIFPEGSVIRPGEYKAFYNSDIKFTLVNTAGSVRLVAISDLLIDETDSYTNAGDNMAWALIDNIWQWTNQLTPNGINLVSLPEVKPAVVVSEPVLPPCKDGQYRSEETHRCRNIINDVVNLVPCAEGQERNPKTNRCRSITTEVLGSSELKPCDPGQERNPETNRCRNIIAAMPMADYAPEQVNVKDNDYTSWYVLGALGLVAAGYGAWEWRVEIGRLFKKISSNK